jgi:hypothetical protein
MKLNLVKITEITCKVWVLLVEHVQSERGLGEKITANMRTGK